MAPAAAAGGTVATAGVVEIRNLSFTYPGIDGHPPPGSTPLIDGLSLSVRAGQRCLLVGANGAGKTTILKIIGGKHMVDPSMVRVFGRSAFHDTALISSGDLSYLGGEWRRDVAFAGFEVSIQMDISAEKMIFGVAGVDPKRREELIKVLDIDLSWRMHKSSDGQRRRVQICMGLLKPFKVLLLDEITVDLDVLARADLLKYLRKECEERGATIIYATHIFDGLDDWPTHIVYVAHGKLQLASPLEEVKEKSNLSLMFPVIESDALEVVTLISADPSCWPWTMHNILTQIKSYLGEGTSAGVRLTFVHQSANLAAHLFAKLTVSNSTPTCYSTPPAELLPFLHTELVL